MSPSLQKTSHTLPTHLTGVPKSAQALVLAMLLEKPLAGMKAKRLLHIAANDQAMQQLASALRFFAPNVEVLMLPAWDVFPYDRSSPNPAIVTERLETLARLAALPPSIPPASGGDDSLFIPPASRGGDSLFIPPASRGGDSLFIPPACGGDVRGGLIVLTTVNAIVQKLPPRDTLVSASFYIKKGTTLNHSAFTEWLVANGYRRVSKAVEAGEFALRGSIIDLIPAGLEIGCRIDLFGDEVEQLRQFDPFTQISAQPLTELTLLPASEILLDEPHIERFRSQYRDMFGAISHPDELYAMVSGGSRYSGMEHLLPLFYESLETLPGYVRPSLITLDEEAVVLVSERHDMIREYHQARETANQSARAGAGVFDGENIAILPPEQLYIMPDEWSALLEKWPYGEFSGFSQDTTKASIDFAMRRGVSIAAQTGVTQPIRQLATLAASRREEKKQTLLACLTKGSRERLLQLVSEQGEAPVRVESWQEISGMKNHPLALAVLPLEHGFEAGDTLIVTEQDVLGDRVIRARPKKRATDAFMAEAAHFSEGELVVHREHGIGRFEGLETITAGGAPHDCLKLIYADGDKLFVPVENIEVITRYGAEEEGAALDKLGSASWQSRKARMKQRITLAAAELMNVAAQRLLRPGKILETDHETYDAFTSRFGFVETEDQARSIDEVIADLKDGKPMDRLICGDVGFGKTEVALRAAYVATHALPKQQVAVVVPTTLLARQHFQNFASRFAGFDVKVRQLSRLTTAKEQKHVKEGLKDGSVDIVIGTHALLAKDIEFKRLGLVIVDEEQHFGVAQKEKLKSLKADVHVLTLSATPIPRTLQLALSGVRDLSLITTPPVDRLAVRSFITPYDPVVLREALLREKHRGGGTFIVTPRIQDIGELRQKITQLVPEIKLMVAHGQIPASELDDIMNRFDEGKCDALISTAIVESGLDIPHANTMIINRADRFGLAQLYQLRGRVGRGKVRAYAYFLLPTGRQLTKQATRRLEVMQTLDRLGAGFTLASHDMDIRGFGNLVGEEQSGHIREVGVELYQQMLAEAVENLKKERHPEHGEGSQAVPRDPSGAMLPQDDDFSPQINLGMAVLIPEDYISDLPLRMGLYKRIAALQTPEEIDALAAEMIDRFGDLPPEVESLLATVRIKQLCRVAGVEKIDAGPKGVVVTFHENAIKHPEKLLNFIAKRPTKLRLRPDQSLFFSQSWPDNKSKISGIEVFLGEVGEAVG